MTNANLISTVQSHIREFRKNLPKDIKQIFTVVCHTEIAKKLTGGNTDGEWYIGAYQSDPENNPLDLSYPYVVNISSPSDHRMPKNLVYVHVKSEGEEETPTNPLTFGSLNTHGVSEHTKPLVFDEQFEERQFNNQIGKSMLSVIMLAKSMSRLKEKAEKLKAIKPLKPEVQQPITTAKSDDDELRSLVKDVADRAKVNAKNFCLSAMAMFANSHPTLGNLDPLFILNNVRATFSLATLDYERSQVFSGIVCSSFILGKLSPFITVNEDMMFLKESPNLCKLTFSDLLQADHFYAEFALPKHAISDSATDPSLLKVIITEPHTDSNQPVGGFVDQPETPARTQEPVLMTWQEVEDTHTAEPVHSAEDIDKALVMKPSNVPETPTHDFQATEKMPDEAWMKTLSMLELRQPTIQELGKAHGSVTKDDKRLSWFKEYLKKNPMPSMKRRNPMPTTVLADTTADELISVMMNKQTSGRLIVSNPKQRGVHDEHVYTMQNFDTTMTNTETTPEQVASANEQIANPSTQQPETAIAAEPQHLPLRILHAEKGPVDDSLTQEDIYPTSMSCENKAVDDPAADEWEYINDNKHAFVIDSKNRCIIRKNKSGKTHVVGGVRVIHPKGVLKAYQAIARVVEGEHDVSDKRLARCVEFHVFTELKVASLLLEKTIDEKIICSLDEIGTKFRAAKMGIMREIDLLKFPESQRNVFLQAADKAKQRYIACTTTE